MNLNKKTLCVITGASRGIGKEISLKSSKKLAPGSVLILTARNESLLEKTAQEIRASNSEIRVKTLAFDLKSSHDNGSDKLLEKCLADSVKEAGSFEAGLIFHNAGSLGDNSKKASEFLESGEIRDYMEINFVSFVLLNNIFLKWTESIEQRAVVNITSLLAVQGVPTYSIYAAGKGAREGFLRVLAVEDKALKVLNYSPGPVLTDMQKEVQERAWDLAVRDFSKNSEKDGKLVTCEETVDKLFHILEACSFESGSHIDYYDM